MVTGISGGLRLGCARDYECRNPYSLSAVVTSVASGIAFTNTGSVTISAGTLDVANAYTQTAGTTFVAIGSTLASSAAINLQGGSLAGFGTVAGNLTNAGTVNPEASERQAPERDGQLYPGRRRRAQYRTRRYRRLR